MLRISLSPGRLGVGRNCHIYDVLKGMSSTSGEIATSVFERIAALDGTNYRSWAFSMKMLLKAHELWEVVEYEDEEETKGKTRKSDAEWHRKDQLALSCIALGLKPSEQEHVYDCGTAKEAWNCLKEIYEGKGTHRFLSLLKSICTASLEDNVKMKDYIRGVRQTADQLLEMNVKLEKPLVIGLVFARATRSHSNHSGANQTIS